MKKDEAPKNFEEESRLFVREIFLSKLLSELLEVLRATCKDLFIKKLKTNIEAEYDCLCWTEKPKISSSARFFLVKALNNDLQDILIQDNAGIDDTTIFTLTVEFFYKKVDYELKNLIEYIERRMDVISGCDYFFRNDCLGLLFTEQLELIHVNYPMEKSLRGVFDLKSFSKYEENIKERQFNLKNIIEAKELLSFIQGGISTIKQSSRLEFVSENESLKLKKIGKCYILLARIKLQDRSEQDSRCHLTQVQTEGMKTIKAKLNRPINKILSRAYSVNVMANEADIKRRNSVVRVIFLLK